jgi:hypothetical protein
MFFEQEKGSGVEYYVVMFRIIDSRPLFLPTPFPAFLFALLGEFLEALVYLPLLEGLVGIYQRLGVFLAVIG